ncbi:transcriptional regulator [Blastococcus brunescens]|uniref:Transcriptional regulator n=1 Tax=Blastococcus brunescens TaxID=1564165 RepID=A0ABZ1B8A1_9ACTN|nr:transcriptional regulator [Blastococcus sp. BMG 8361]WRL66048.1 transcriptional regulator [Blastococcus sp. BMG 8361]
MASGRRAAAPRWAGVGVLVAVLLALPPFLGALPAEDSDVSAADLRDAVLAADGIGFSGHAESAGGLALPVGDQLPAVADLFSDRTTMRVWWRGGADHRVDVLGAAGETGYHRDPAGQWIWEYESATATRADAAAAGEPFALPGPPDLLPNTLGRRLVSEATDAELSRIGARRVSGRPALGLRVTPAEEASSVARADVWVDADSGLPLQVQIVGDDGGIPAVDTRFLDLEIAGPEAGVIAFRPPEGARVREAQEADIAREAAERLRPTALPATLDGLPRRTGDGVPAGIGLYGRGITLLAVAPVPRRLAAALENTLSASPDAVDDDAGLRAAAGPVGLMVVRQPGSGSYLLTGTVSLDALASAAAELPDLGDQR